MAKRAAVANGGGRPGPSPYAGQWVARVQGRIVGHGGTPAAARLAAQTQRHKERPEISFMAPEPSLKFPPLVEQVARIAGDKEIFLVGGVLRDALLGRVTHDFDFAVQANAIALARRVAGALEADFYILDETFDAARVIAPAPNGVRDVLDFSAFRGSDLDADLEGRDFTINAIAMNLKDRTILDPLNGASDLRKGIIRACSKSALRDDPVRILRAIRQAAAFDFKIEAATRAAMKEAVNRLPTVSAERQRDELFKILGGARADAALRALEILGVFPYLLPELTSVKHVEQPAPHVYDVWEHTLSVVQSLDWILNTLAPDPRGEQANGILASLLTLGLGRYRSQLARHFAGAPNPDRTRRSLLTFVALYHDVSKPTTKSKDEAGRIHFIGHDRQGAAVAAERCRQLNLSNDEVALIETLILNHMRFFFLASRMETDQEEPSRKAMYRFFRDAGESGVDLILLGLADLRGARGHTLTEQAWSAFIEVARHLLENYWEKPGETVSPPRLVDGHDIMQAYGLQQGPTVGEVLEAIREAQATGMVSTREEALGFGRTWLQQRHE